MVSKKQILKNDTNIVVAKKRGRKSKKELEENQLKLDKEQSNTENNINVIIDDSNHMDTLINNFEKLLDNNTVEDNNVIVEDNNVIVEDNNVIVEGNNVIVEGNNNIILQGNNIFLSEDEKSIPKKRGRKPKGGKIIQQVILNENNKEVKPNVILHLKCSLKDLYSNSILENDIQSYNFSNTTQLSYDVINENSTFNNKVDQLIISNEKNNDSDYEEPSKENDIRDIWKKLKILEHNLHTNNICDKKSACFWCTYDFDNPPVYIPKHNIKDTYHVYGCFCSPECATAYLMEEHIDSSSKFERYHLMNHIYTKIYNYNKNIKPAPNPYYMLDKYYGNLTIQEYRSLLRNERLFLVVDKPLTRILPELHEENDDFIINNKIIPSNTYQIKKKIQKQNKSNILSERFGISQKQ